MNRLTRAIALSTLLLPTAVFAAETYSWDFRGNVPTGTTPQHLTTVQVAKEGMYVQTTTDGLIEFPTPPIEADSAVITLTNVTTPRFALVWRDDDLAEGEYYQYAIELPTGSERRAAVDLASIDGWDGRPTDIGIAFPAGTEVLLQSVEWKAYGPIEETWNQFLSFWTTDTFRMYSINFLWGPLIGSTPEARATLYEKLPPTAWSATRALYGAFLAALAVAAAAKLLYPEKGGQHARTTILVAGAALWILFDIRMTQEIVTYAARDWSTYVLAAPADRTLRTHAGLYDVLKHVKASLGNDERYVLVTKEGTPFFANIRYTLYPATPAPQSAPNGATAWIVLGMPELTVTGGVIVRSDGTPLSPKGTVVERYDDTSFFFRTQ